MAMQIRADNTHLLFQLPDRLATAALSAENAQVVAVTIVVVTGYHLEEG